MMDDQELETQQSSEEESEDAVLEELLTDQDLDDQEEQSEDELETAQDESRLAGFMSEDEVPEELREQWRNMNRKFTQTQQELARKRKELDALIQQLGAVAQGQRATPSGDIPGAQPGQDVNSDPVLQMITEQYNIALEEQDTVALQRLAAEFQNRLQTLQIQKEIDSLKQELAASKSTAQLNQIKKNPLFTHVLGPDEEKAVLEKIKSGLDPEEAAWAVLGRKVAALAAQKAHQMARRAKATGQMASVQPGRPASPAVEIDEIPSHEVMSGDRPSVAKIWEFIKRRGPAKR